MRNDTITTVTMTRLTPPQVKAVVSHLPAMVKAGVITSKLSQVTVHQARQAPDTGLAATLGRPWSAERFTNLLRHHAAASGDKTLAKVVEKMTERPELLRVETHS